MRNILFACATPSLRASDNRQLSESTRCSDLRLYQWKNRNLDKKIFKQLINLTLKLTDLVI